MINWSFYPSPDIVVLGFWELEKCGKVEVGDPKLNVA